MRTSAGFPASTIRPADMTSIWSAPVEYGGAAVPYGEFLQNERGGRPMSITGGTRFVIAVLADDGSVFTSVPSLITATRSARAVTSPECG